MSVDLATQIRNYAVQVDGAQAPLTIDEIMELRVGVEPVRPIGSRVERLRTRRRTRGVLVAVAVAAAILLLVGGVAWLLRPQATVAPADQPTTTTSTIASTDSEPLGAVGEWSIHAPTFDASKAP